MGKIDSETVFNVLVAEGLDVPTAYTASLDSAPTSADRNAATNRFYFDAGLVVGLIGLILWYFV